MVSIILYARLRTVEDVGPYKCCEIFTLFAQTEPSPVGEGGPLAVDEVCFAKTRFFDSASAPLRMTGQRVRANIDWFHNSVRRRREGAPALRHTHNFVRSSTDRRGRRSLRYTCNFDGSRIVSIILCARRRAIRESPLRYVCNSVQTQSIL